MNIEVNVVVMIQKIQVKVMIDREENPKQLERETVTKMKIAIKLEIETMCQENKEEIC